MPGIDRALRSTPEAPFSARDGRRARGSGRSATSQRFVSSVREVVDAEGVQVVSNEVYPTGPDRRAVPASPLRPETLSELTLFGYQPPHSELLSTLP